MTKLLPITNVAKKALIKTSIQITLYPVASSCWTNYISSSGMSIYKMPFEPNCFPWDDDYNGRCQSGTLQRIWDPSVMLFSTMLTADNDWCAADMPCGYYNRSYKWCVKAEIDEKGNTEGYCCEGECRNYMCPVGDRISLCSPISTVSSSGEWLLVWQFAKHN